ELSQLKYAYYNLRDDTDLKDALGVIIHLQEETQELEVRLNFGADVFHRLS
ncbi:hypothetical protein TNCV_61591, partial [Trichonephila clavipes]